jgi:hypothetical protein
MQAIIFALNTAYDVEEERSYWMTKHPVIDAFTLGVYRGWAMGEA